MDPKKSTTELVEKRRAPRRPVLYRLDVTDASDRLVGYLVDISLGGMRVRCTAGTNVNEANHLRVVLPRWMDLGETLDFSGRFAWCKPADDERVEGGFVFDGLSDRDRSALDAFIERIADAAVEDSQL